MTTLGIRLWDAPESNIAFVQSHIMDLQTDIERGDLINITTFLYTWAKQDGRMIILYVKSVRSLFHLEHLDDLMIYC